MTGTDDTWHLPPPCRSEDPELFFSDVPRDITEAKAICRRCPIRSDCLAGALERREPTGVWGGQQFNRGLISHPGERADPKGTCRGCQGPAATAQSRYCDDCRPGNYPTKPIDHGSEAGARAHYRRGEPPCRPCREAANRVATDRRPTRAKAAA